MKRHLNSYASWLTTEIRNAGASFDPEVLQLPGGTLIAAGLWLYSRSALAIENCRHRPH